MEWTEKRAAGQIVVTLLNGVLKELPHGATVEDLAGSIGRELKKSAIGGRIDGKLVDVYAPIEADASVEVVTPESPEGLAMLRHSTAHLMAQAIKRLFGYEHVSLGVGPVIEGGFYYDVDVPRPIRAKELAEIEAEMVNIVKEDLPIQRRMVNRGEVIHLFNEIGDGLKLELIRDLPGNATITIYEQGEFIDLCRGPHVPSTGRIKAFKLLSVGAAYWRGDAHNKSLQRIYGTSFPNKRELDEHLAMLEEAKRRDHRKLGRELNMFMFAEEAPGMPFYLPNGLIVRNELENFERSLQHAAGYEEVRTPLMMNQRLWEESGHWNHYHENMYFADVDETKFALKPMNCPGHMLIYKNATHSYRDLPIRLSENGQVHRHELSGTLNGMLRVRTFTQDDAHIFVRPDQIEDEIAGIIELIKQIYGVFGFSYQIELSTRPANSMGSDGLWEAAETALQNVLASLDIPYRLNEGDGAFYGPKIDFHVRDALGRNWQCGTIQLDFQMPEKFDLNYIGEDNQKRRPVVIHRAIFGSVDRFIGILTEHFAGAFPLWLAPVQAKVVPVSDKFAEYAEAVRAKLVEAGLRVDIDLRNEKIGYKIRETQMHKIPYTLVVGKEEVAADAVAVRQYGKGDQGQMRVDDFLAQALTEAHDKTIH